VKKLKKMKTKEVNNMRKQTYILVLVLALAGLAMVGTAGAIGNFWNSAPQDWGSMSNYGTMEVRLGGPGIAAPSFGWTSFSAYRASPIGSRPFITGVRTSWRW
jgi:hypothetical protein